MLIIVTKHIYVVCELCILVQHTLFIVLHENSHDRTLRRKNPVLFRSSWYRYLSILTPNAVWRWWISLHTWITLLSSPLLPPARLGLPTHQPFPFISLFRNLHDSLSQDIVRKKIFCWKIISAYSPINPTGSESWSSWEKCTGKQLLLYA